MLLARFLLGMAAGAIAAGAAAGWIVSAPRYRGPGSDHFDGCRFQNVLAVRQAGTREMVR